MNIMNIEERVTKFVKHKNFLIRIFFIILFLIPIVNTKEFYNQFYDYLTGNIITQVITQQWHIVIINIALFISFLIPLSFRKKANWIEYGLVSAFFVSLFVEMYGIPLTILFASKYFFTGTNLPNTLFGFKFLGVSFGLPLAMVYGLVLMIIGTFLIITGWVTLYRNTKKDGLVTTGIYSYSRHPQYVGFILVILGWFFGWPTVLTVILSPILIFRYIQVSFKEEQEVSKQFPEYKTYKKGVPFFI